MVAFYEITRGYKVTLHVHVHKTETSKLFVQLTLNILKTIQNFKKYPSVPQQSCSDGIARKLPRVATHKSRKLTPKN